MLRATSRVIVPENGGVESKNDPKCPPTYSVDHVNTVVEALHQLPLALCGGLDEELAGSDKLPGLSGQQLLSPEEGRLVPVLALPGQAEHLGLSEVLGHMGHHLLRLSEDNHSASHFQGLVILSIRLVHTGTL